jgi:hypothetical protein
MLKIENYGKVLIDCSKALKLNPKNIKAYYRSVKALYALDKIEEAIDCCEHGLAVKCFILILIFLFRD